MYNMGGNKGKLIICKITFFFHENLFFFQAQVTLETSHIGKGCDRDTYNLASQRQLCGASELALDLLPDPDQVKKIPNPFFFKIDTLFLGSLYSLHLIFSDWK